MAETVEDNGGVYFVPALTGLAAPSWDATARGLLIGISPGTTRWLRRYGGNAHHVAAAGSPEPIADTEISDAEIRHAVDHEMAMTIADVLVRRTGSFFWSADGDAAAIEHVSNVLAERHHYPDTVRTVRLLRQPSADSNLLRSPFVFARNAAIIGKCSSVRPGRRSSVTTHGLVLRGHPKKSSDRGEPASTASISGRTRPNGRTSASLSRATVASTQIRAALPTRSGCRRRCASTCTQPGVGSRSRVVSAQLAPPTPMCGRFATRQTDHD